MSPKKGKEPKKPKTPNVLSSTSNGNTKKRETTVWGKKKK